jgi:hypothetical protein
MSRRSCHRCARCCISRTIIRGPQIGGTAGSDTRCRGPIDATVAIRPAGDRHRAGENLWITGRWSARGAGSVDNPRHDAIAPMHADAADVGTVNRVIDNFSPEAPRDVVLG